MFPAVTSPIYNANTDQGAELAALKLPLVILVELVPPEPSDMLLASCFVDLIQFSLEYTTQAQYTYLFDLCWRKLEGHCAQVVTQPLLLRGGRNRDDVLVNTPTQGDLAGAHSILLRERIEDVIGWTACTLGHCSERPVCRCRNALR
jgi:hypothetical protein